MIEKKIYICHRDLEYVKNVSIPKWKKLNPEYEISIYDDNICEEFLKNEFSQNHCDIFKFIDKGYYKSDFWRVCILYKYGGIYVDADVEPLVPLNRFIDDDDTFSTCLSFFSNEMNPHFIMCEKENPNMKRCIDEFVAFYNEKMKNKETSVYLSIPRVFEKIFKYIFDYGITKDGKYKINNEVIKLMKENYNGYDKWCVYNNIVLLNNKDKKYPKIYNL
jgi:mannosyltransferase OCH1-like enzyme